MKNKIIVLLLFLSCSGTKDKIPQEILSEDIFISILKEVHLAEAYFELNKSYNKNDRNNKLNLKFQQAFKEYSIDEKQFQITMDYYASNPNQLESIYTKIIAQLSEQKANVDQQ